MRGAVHLSTHPFLKEDCTGCGASRSENMFYQGVLYLQNIIFTKHAYNLFFYFGLQGTCGPESERYSLNSIMYENSTEFTETGQYMWKLRFEIHLRRKWILVSIGSNKKTDLRSKIFL
jgi:hypothetical protein